MHYQTIYWFFYMKRTAQNRVLRDVRKRNKERNDKINNGKRNKLCSSRNDITMNTTRRIRCKGNMEQ
jgi:hypothetical protein